MCVKNYLNEFKFANAEQDDLWRYLTQQAHNESKLNESITVKDIMDTWTLQMGYPVVDVRREGKKLNLTQRWFLLSPLSKMRQPQNAIEYNKHKWFIPFTMTSSDKLQFDFESDIYWLKPDVDECEILFGFFIR